MGVIFVLVNFDITIWFHVKVRHKLLSVLALVFFLGGGALTKYAEKRCKRDFSFIILGIRW